MSILGPADYNSVRWSLDSSLSPTDLPDEVIEDQVYQGAAEAVVMARVPDYASLTGSAYQALKRAAVLLTAAYLAPAIPRLTVEAFGEYRYQREQVDWTALAGSLQARADDVLNEVLGTSAAAALPTLFARGSGSRGRL